MPPDNPKGSMNLPESKLPWGQQLGEVPLDFRSSFHWRVFRIMSEFVDGWQFITDYKNTVSILGSARFAEDNKWYQVARELGALLAKKKIGVVTGAGPGIMEGGNRGAYESGGESIGISIRLPFEQRNNPYITKSQPFYYFFVRKVMLFYTAQAYVFFPGGFGTLDEFFELVTLVQTHKIDRESVPLILVGKEFWTPLISYISDTVYEKYKAIDKEDMQLYHLIDTAQEAMDIISKSPPRKEIYY
ncbi:MAG: TIGR00730 family Rossman fold protein [Patescibacteria group bacterium]